MDESQARYDDDNDEPREHPPSPMRDETDRAHSGLGREDDLSTLGETAERGDDTAPPAINSRASP
jgi:hypothetical protein